jgi:hypothetical protein
MEQEKTQNRGKFTQDYPTERKDYGVNKQPVEGSESEVDEAVERAESEGMNTSDKEESGDEMGSDAA